MATVVIMPKVDMDQEAGTVRAWMKQNGDAVTAGETILEIETDKVAIEVEAPASGVLAGILVEEGETVPIATTIAYILAEGEALPASAAVAMRKGPGHEAPPSAEAVPPAGSSTPVARKMAAEAGIDVTAVPGSGPRGKVTKQDVAQALLRRTAEPRPYATPAARRVALEKRIDLGTLNGRGPDGRVQEADVLAAAAAQAQVEAAPIPAGLSYTVEPLQGMRRTIATRLSGSAQEIPHVHFTLPLDMTAFEAARTALNQRAAAIDAPRVSATALLMKMIAAALARHPRLNSHFVEDEIRLFETINLGMAVALPEGLIVPVIKGAAQKGVGQLAAEVHDLAERARTGSLTPADVREGTFTISNLGPFGIEQFTAIINPPQTAILAVGATRAEVVPGDGGTAVVRPIMRVTLAVDHRVIDGAAAAQFLDTLKTLVEAPLQLLW